MQDRLIRCHAITNLGTEAVTGSGGNTQSAGFFKTSFVFIGMCNIQVLTILT